MRTRISEALKGRFETDVLNILVRESGSCAISYLRTSLERSGGGRWRGLGTWDEFEDSLLGSGFDLRKEYGPGGVTLRTYVELGK